MSTWPHTQDQLDELFGPDEKPERMLRLADSSRTLPPASDLPGADEMADRQFIDAVARVHEDARLYPQYPWPQLADLAGPICPGDFILVAARTGGGKSLFLQNLFDALVCGGRFGLYVGLEQTPEILRVKWACLRSDVAPKLVLAPRVNERGTAEWQRAMDLVQAELKWQKSLEMRVRAHFAEARKINAKGLKAWTSWAVDQGCEFVMIDHIDRVQHGDGKNSFHEMSETVRLAKELANEHRIAMIVASQVGRPADALEQFMPPSLHALRGGGTKEEEADTVLGIYRPLRVNVTEQELKQVRQGLRDRSHVLEPNVMGLMLLKHRLDGPVAGKVVKLGVRHQRVFTLDEKDRWSTAHGRAQEEL